jgi:peptide/nickel transport system ATP-binding protein
VRPELLLLDEPTSALDVSVQAQVLNLFKTLKQQYGFTIVFVTHDLALISFICDHTIVMKSGAIVEQGPTTEVISRPKAAYTRALIDAAPKIPETPAA